MAEPKRFFRYISKEGKKEVYCVRCDKHSAQRAIERAGMTPDVLLDAAAKTLACAAISKGWNKNPWRESDGEPRAIVIRVMVNNHDLTLMCATAINQLSIDTVYPYRKGMYLNVDDERYSIINEKVIPGIKGIKEKN